MKFITQFSAILFAGNWADKRSLIAEEGSLGVVVSVRKIDGDASIYIIGEGRTNVNLIIQRVFAILVAIIITIYFKS